MRYETIRTSVNIVAQWLARWTRFSVVKDSIPTTGRVVIALGKQFTYISLVHPSAKQVPGQRLLFVWLVGWFLNVLVNYKVILRTGPKTERLTILRAATRETELRDHDFCLSS